MLHELKYRVGSLPTGQAGSESLPDSYRVRSSLIVKGTDALRTAMAKTVGLPLGIAAKNILNGKIKLSGLHIPVIKEIYMPVLRELEEYDIKFTEVSLTVTDILGNIKFSSREMSGYGYSRKIDTQSLPAGIYLVRVEYDGEENTLRIVKQ